MPVDSAVGTTQQQSERAAAAAATTDGAQKNGDASAGKAQRQPGNAAATGTAKVAANGVPM
eukprot:8833398-Lingulodinium_polyedra.AAC.1